VNRQAQSVVLLLVGGAILRASLTDLYLRYVKQGLRPFLIAAGVLLVATAVATLRYELKGTSEPGHDHGHAHGGPKVAWLLILPVLGLLLVAPPALGSYAAGRSGTALSVNSQSDYAPLPKGDPVDVTMLDYASRAVFDDGRSLNDRRVRVTGFLTPGPGGTWLLNRMILSCCAADARPVKVALTGRLPDAPVADSWLRVTGQFVARSTKDPVNGERIPFIDVLSTQSIAAPAEQYES
jgi:uncharacterized repeat protein (TIGR03943 family)